MRIAAAAVSMIGRKRELLASTTAWGWRDRCSFAVMSGMEMLPWHKRYATDFFLVALVCAVGPYAWFYNREMARLGEVPFARRGYQPDCW